MTRRARAPFAKLVPLVAGLLIFTVVYAAH